MYRPKYRSITDLPVPNHHLLLQFFTAIIFFLVFSLESWADGRPRELLKSNDFFFFEKSVLLLKPKTKEYKTKITN
jgi:hypothetical protein